LIGQPEDACFDCKEWPARDDDAQKMLAKAACGLTNAEGGVLVIGLKAESKPKDEPDVVGSIAPVKDTSLAKSRVLNLIGNLVEPGIVGIEVTEVSLQKRHKRRICRGLYSRVGGLVSPFEEGLEVLSAYWCWNLSDGIFSDRR
jgi:predicted HTH transcriptional regulator